MTGPRPTAHEVRVLPHGLFVGRTALVTGAGSGIGRAITLRLLELGADVIGVGRRAAALEQTHALASDPARLRTAPLDIRDRPAAAACVGALDRLDLLVNNAGGQFVAPASDISARGFSAVLDLNLTATAALIAAARPALVAAGGRVVTLSLSAPERGVPGLVHSSAARAAVQALSRQLAGDGVRLFCLAPGTVLTAGVADELLADALLAGVRASLLRRDTGAEEVAEWVAALGSGLFDRVRDAVVELDGGAGLTDAAAALLPAQLGASA